MLRKILGLYKNSKQLSKAEQSQQVRDLLKHRKPFKHSPDIKRYSGEERRQG